MGSIQNLCNIIQIYIEQLDMPPPPLYFSFFFFSSLPSLGEVMVYVGLVCMFCVSQGIYGCIRECEINFRMWIIFWFVILIGI